MSQKTLLIAVLCAFGAVAHAQNVQQVAMADLKVDLKILANKKVAVSASLQSMGDVSMLKSDTFDMNPVWAGTDKLSRDDRKKIANGCQLVLCTGKFTGVIKNLPLGIGMDIEKVEWH